MSEPKKLPDSIVPYSTLEVDNRDAENSLQVAYAENLNNNLLISNKKYAEYLESGNAQVADHTLPEVLDSNVGPGNHQRDEKEAKEEGKRIWGRRRRSWVILGLALLAIVILGAVLGGVLGSRSKSSGFKNGIANATLLEGQTISPNASIASAIWTDSQSVQHTALFIQNTSNSVLHLDWNSATNTWSLRNELAVFQSTGTVPTPKSGTPLAATGIQSTGYQGLWNSSIEYPASFNPNLHQFPSLNLSC
jgi:hypothetical protein